MTWAFALWTLESLGADAGVVSRRVVDARGPVETGSARGFAFLETRRPEHISGWTRELYVSLSEPETTEAAAKSLGQAAQVVENPSRWARAPGTRHPTDEQVLREVERVQQAPGTAANVRFAIQRQETIPQVSLGHDSVKAAGR